MIISKYHRKRPKEQIQYAQEDGAVQVEDQTQRFQKDKLERTEEGPGHGVEDGSCRFLEGGFVEGVSC